MEDGLRSAVGAGAPSAYQAAARRAPFTTTWLHLGEIADRMVGASHVLVSLAVVDVQMIPALPAGASPPSFALSEQAVRR